MEITRLGVESQVCRFLPHGPSGVVEARFRVISEDGQLASGDFLKVRVVARVYDPAEVLRRQAVPEVPIAEGPEIERHARTDMATAIIPLPSVVKGEHAVVAKVYSADERYRRAFEPSLCYVAMVRFGHEVRMRASDLDLVYRGATGNASAEEQIRKYVRGGGVRAIGDAGEVFRAGEHHGKLVLRPMDHRDAGHT